jgi:GMP synthase-like glutamine amidotransferase
VKILLIVHQDDAGPGVFADSLDGHEAELWQPAGGDDPPPAFDALITFGGGMHVDQEAEHPWLATEKRLLAEALERRVPTLGVCLGSQLVAEAAGAHVGPADRPEVGWYDVDLTDEARRDPLMRGMPGRLRAFEWHSYGFDLPPGAVALARSEVGLQAYRLGELVWGVQFHAEVTADSLSHWFEAYRDDDEVHEAGADLAAVARETEQRIEDWNDFGRTLCSRFAERAEEGAQRRAAGAARRYETR